MRITLTPTVRLVPVAVLSLILQFPGVAVAMRANDIPLPSTVATNGPDLTQADMVAVVNDLIEIATDFAADEEVGDQGFASGVKAIQEKRKEEGPLKQALGDTPSSPKALLTELKMLQTRLGKPLSGADKKAVLVQLARYQAMATAWEGTQRTMQGVAQSQTTIQTMKALSQGVDKLIGALKGNCRSVYQGFPVYAWTQVCS